jgi:hypothetical protein
MNGGVNDEGIADDGTNIVTSEIQAMGVMDTLLPVGFVPSTK